jgi:hypothetical protein
LRREANLPQEKKPDDLPPPLKVLPLEYRRPPKLKPLATRLLNATAMASAVMSKPGKPIKRDRPQDEWNDADTVRVIWLVAVIAIVVWLASEYGK